VAGRCPARYFLRKTRAPALSRPFFFFGTLTERRHGGGVEATAVLCRLGAGRECRKMNANRKAQGRGGSPSGPKTQARRRRLPQTKSSRRAAGTQVSAQFSTTPPNHTRFQPARSKSGSEAQAGLGGRVGSDGRAAVMQWR
jgi:hypothetical protein